MYVPKSFEVSDSSVLDDFIVSHSFATLISTVNETFVATHLPLILDRTEYPQGVLLGHVARANPHWRAFDGQQEALAIFSGPHAYISPTGTVPRLPCRPGTTRSCISTVFLASLRMKPGSRTWSIG